jgi:hypothetical protein
LNGAVAGAPFIARVRQKFVGRDPTLRRAIPWTCLLSVALFLRTPSTGFVFDEREALLANPYVRAAGDPASNVGWLQAFGRDFWGLPPERTIGTYRPIPDLVWRLLWTLGLREKGALAIDVVNVLLHGVNGALLVLLAFRWTRDRRTAWLAGAIFVATAVVTEAVSGMVGLADVLAGTAALLALLALDLPLRKIAPAIFGATLLGLYSKESSLCIVALVPVAALFVQRERPWGRALVAAAAGALAFVVYVEMRRLCFPVRTPPELSEAFNADKDALQRAYAAVLRWYAQPTPLHDPLNNPFVRAPPALRVAGALRVYASGLGQLLLPSTLSADYSAQQETVPRTVVFAGSVLGGAAMVLPVLGALAVAFLSRRRQEARGGVAPIVAFALVWVVASYFPVSNIPVVLPTVRADRFWYLPAIGSAIVLAIGLAKGVDAAAGRLRTAAVGLVAVFLGTQAWAARMHAFDYASELAFWDAACKSSPRSAKAHLNRSIALGAQGDLAGRLVESEAAVHLAPRWPTALVYEGEALCRLHRAGDGAVYTVRGLELATNDHDLVELALKCLLDEHALAAGTSTHAAMQDLAARHPGTRLAAAVDQALQGM